MNTSDGNIIPQTLNKWVRVTKQYPCRVCGKPDWCEISADGKAAICARIQSDKQAGQAGWLHRLDCNSPVRIPQPKSVKQNPKANIEVLDNTYRNLLANLPLSAKHKENLINRGIPESLLCRYGTMPRYGREDILRNLQSQNIRLNGVPGFFTDINGKWHLGGPDGICIPVTNLQSRVSGIQIRRDGDVKPKYVWLSSKDKLNGCSSGASIHVARPGNADTKAIWITEGPLKADIISLKLNRIVLAIPGVSNWAGVIPIIWQLKPKSVVVALDMDKLTNEAVNLHKNQLINRLLRLNIRTIEADWNGDYKGLDDFLKGTLGDKDYLFINNKASMVTGNFEPVGNNKVTVW